MLLKPRTRRPNTLAEALGYLPLVVRSDSALLMSPGVSDVARQALIDAQPDPSPGRRAASGLTRPTACRPIRSFGAGCMIDERQIIREVLAGRRERFREIVQRYQRPLLALVKNLVGDAHEAEDIAQEAFVAAYLNLARFDATRARLSTWLFVIARNRAVNHLQRRRPQPAGQSIQNAAAPGGDDAAEQGELFRQLDAALERLPLAQRTAFVLAEIHGLAYEEVARIEQVKLGTVKSRISRAKEKLRAALRGAVDEEQWSNTHEPG